MSNGDQPTTIRVPILRLIKEAQQKHGLRQGNYLRYRGYCTRRLRRLRRSLKFTHQQKSFPKRPAKFILRPVVPEVINDERFLEIVIFEIERHWAYSMHLKIDMGDNVVDRQKFHMRQKLRRAAKCSNILLGLVKQCESIDVSTKFEAQAYGSFIKANVCVEFKQWEKALRLLSVAQKIYERFAQNTNDESSKTYKSRCQDIDNLMRLCKFHRGGESNAAECPSATSIEQEMLDLDFNKLSVEHEEVNVKEAVEEKAVEILESIPCKPMFFDIAMNYL